MKHVITLVALLFACSANAHTERFVGVLSRERVMRRQRSSGAAGVCVEGLISLQDSWLLS
jgi:hypothetical protein